MVLHDAMRFSIDGDKIICNTPSSGIDIPDFLQIMRRVLETHRKSDPIQICTVSETPAPGPSCARGG